MNSIGPFPLSVVLLALALAVGWLATRQLARPPAGQRASAATGLLADAVLLGLVVARLGYVLWWWRDYLASPWSIIAVGDGGFLPWPGLAAACLFSLWASRHRRWLRLPALAGLGLAAVAWLAGQGALALAKDTAPDLPPITLTQLDGTPLALDSLRGRPVVLNLWATWCPPCRREMPVFARVQAAYPEVALVMANQGGSLAEVQAYLQQNGLDFAYAVRDPHSLSMQAMGAHALPSTLFFNARGELVDTHLGELTSATLRHRLSRHFDLPPRPVADLETLR